MFKKSNQKILLNENNEVVVIENKNDKNTNNKKFLIVISLIFVLILGCTYFYQNFFFKLFPEHVLEISLFNTYNTFNKESQKTFKKLDALYVGGELSDINSMDFQKDDRKGSITFFDDYLYGNLTFYDTLTTYFYKDDDGLIYSFDGKNYIDTNMYSSSKNKNPVQKTQMGISTFFENKLENRIPTELVNLLVKENKVSSDDENFYVTVSYTKDEFIILENFLSANINNDIFDYYINLLNKNADMFNVTYVIKQNGKYKNIISTVKITDNTTKYLEISLPNDEFLFDEIMVKSNILFKENSYYFRTDFKNDFNTLYLSINDNTYSGSLNFDNEKLNILIDNGLSVYLSQNINTMEKPENVKPLVNSLIFSAQNLISDYIKMYLDSLQDLLSLTLTEKTYKI